MKKSLLIILMSTLLGCTKEGDGNWQYAGFLMPNPKIEILELKAR